MTVSVSAESEVPSLSIRSALSVDLQTENGRCLLLFPNDVDPGQIVLNDNIVVNVSSDSIPYKIQTSGGQITSNTLNPLDSVPDLVVQDVISSDLPLDFEKSSSFYSRTEVICITILCVQIANLLFVFLRRAWHA